MKKERVQALVITLLALGFCASIFTFGFTSTVSAIVCGIVIMTLSAIALWGVYFFTFGAYYCLAEAVDIFKKAF